jgi:surface protein
MAIITKAFALYLSDNYPLKMIRFQRVPNCEIDSFINKCKLLNYNIRQYKYNGEICTVDVEDTLLVISENFEIIDGEQLFKNSVYKGLDLRNIDTHKMIKTDRMFYCANIQDLQINTFDTRNVTSMEYMFAFSIIKKLDISELDVDKVNNFLRMFYYCNIVDELKLFRLDTSRNGVYISGIFERFSASVLDLSSIEINNYLSIPELFRNNNSNVIKLTAKSDKHLKAWSRQFKSWQNIFDGVKDKIQIVEGI